MDLPIDIGKVKKAAEEISGNQHQDFFVDVYVDTSANNDLVGYVSYLLSPKFENANVDYLDLSEYDYEYYPDFCVIVAGDDCNVADIYFSIIADGVPCVVVSVVPFLLYEMDERFKDDCNRKNIVYPKFHDYYINDITGELEYDKLNKKMMKTIKSRLADWFVSESESLLLAAAYNFPAFRTQASMYCINSTSIQNVAIACVPFLRGADMPIMTLNEAKMVLSLAVMYENEINVKIIPEIVILTLSAFGLKYASSALTEKNPKLKVLISGAFGFFGTQALGHVAEIVFGNGGSFQNILETFKCPDSLLPKKIKSIISNLTNKSS